MTKLLSKVSRDVRCARKRRRRIEAKRPEGYVTCPRCAMETWQGYVACRNCGADLPGAMSR